MIRFIKSYVSVLLFCGMSLWCAGGDDLAHYLDDPCVCAFLDTIAWAEGTLTKDALGYKVIYGNKTFNDFSDHPRRVVCAFSKGEFLCSSAAGKYQFLQSTWDKVADKTGAKDFSPHNQDCGAVYLLLSCGALQTLQQKYASQSACFFRALRKINRIWASMPGAPYNQPTKKEQELYDVYKKLVVYHKNRLYKTERTV